MATPVANFPGENRVHIALGATDLAASIAFYRILFGIEPSKLRADYAKFTPADPSLNRSRGFLSSFLESPASVLR